MLGSIDSLLQATIIPAGNRREIPVIDLFRRNKMPSIVALLPAYNEEVSIGSVVLRTKQYADRVVVIDDGSRDRTAEVAAMAGAEVLHHSKNQGKGAALKTGFGSVNGDSVIVTIDTDGQHNPDDIPCLAKLILTGEADMESGSRYLNGDGKDTPLYRWLESRHVLDTATSLAPQINKFSRKIT